MIYSSCMIGNDPLRVDKDYLNAQLVFMMIDSLIQKEDVGRAWSVKDTPVPDL